MQSPWWWRRNGVVLPRTRRPWPCFGLPAVMSEHPHHKSRVCGWSRFPPRLDTSSVFILLCKLFVKQPSRWLTSSSQLTAGQPPRVSWRLRSELLDAQEGYAVPGADLYQLASLRVIFLVLRGWIPGWWLHSFTGWFCRMSYNDICQELGFTIRYRPEYT